MGQDCLKVGDSHNLRLSTFKIQSWPRVLPTVGTQDICRNNSPEVTKGHGKTLGC